MFQFTSPPMPHYMTMGEDTYPIGGKHPDRVNIGNFDLIAVTRGSLHLEEEGTVYEIASGDYLILHPQRHHRTVTPCRTETHFYWLHFHTTGPWHVVDLKQMPSPVNADPAMTSLEQFTFYLSHAGSLQAPELTYETLRRLMQMQDDPTAISHWKRQQLFLEVLLTLQDHGGSPKGSPHLIVAEEAATYIRQHYQGSLDYAKLSEALHFHANYISLCMKEVFGCTPLEYWTRYRIGQAKQRLIHTNDPIGQIAQETGFGSFPYFVRCFSKHTGMKPSAFRMQHR